jgi:hypothetical protein
MIEIEYPLLDWSFTRHKTLMECKLKYRRSYYSYWNGWQKDANAIQKHTYRLKKITNLEMLLGNKVHEYIDKIITSGFNRNLINEKVMFKTIWDDIEDAMQKSFSDYNIWYEKPKLVYMLHEVYYENNISNEKIADLKERLRRIIHNLFENMTFTNMIENKVHVQRDSEKYRFMKRNGVKIWVRMDLHYTNPINKTRTVVDWKNGKSTIDDRYQLALYAHFVSKAYKVNNLDNIEIRNEYLLNNESKSYILKQIDIDNMKELIKSSIEHMKGFLIDVEKNIPHEESCFEKTTNPNICSRCNFKEMCLVS